MVAAWIPQLGTPLAVDAKSLTESAKIVGVNEITVRRDVGASNDAEQPEDSAEDTVANAPNDAAPVTAGSVKGTGQRRGAEQLRGG